MPEVPEIQVRERFEEPADIQTTFRTSENGIAELTKALCAARKNFDPIKKNAENPFYKDGRGKSRKYADLSEMIAATADPLADQGLAIIQAPIIQDRLVGMTTLLTHTSGQWIEFTVMGVPAEQKTKEGTTFDAQKQGIGFTYAARYSYRALLNLGTDDDDGNGLVSQPTGPKIMTIPAIERGSDGSGGTYIRQPMPPAKPSSESERTDPDGCPKNDSDIGFKSDKPSPAELTGYGKRLKALNFPDNRKLRTFFEAEAKSAWSDTSKAEFDRVVGLIETLHKENKLSAALES